MKTVQGLRTMVSKLLILPTTGTRTMADAVPAFYGFAGPRTPESGVPESGITEPGERRTFEAGSADATAARVVLGGAEVDLLALPSAIDLIAARALRKDTTPLAVASANLDHINHFGAGSRWASVLGGDSTVPEGAPSLEWLTLLDGAPLVSQAERLTGRHWPRLAGSDLIGPLLDVATSLNLSVGFLGGAREAQESLKERLGRERPGLILAGFWSPSREDLTDAEVSTGIAAEIAAAGVDILVVGLGKPRQELWIAEYGSLTGASVLLAFGAVVDFLAGRVKRAPEWVSSKGLEWAWRLALEPRRLARRYLLDGPPAYASLRINSSVIREQSEEQREQFVASAPVGFAPPPVGNRAFAPVGQPADVAVLVVTYNNAQDVDLLIESLRAEAADQWLRVIVADNGSSDGTLEALARHGDVISFATGGNLGYSGGINAAQQHCGDVNYLLVANPDLVIERGSVAALIRRQRNSKAGIVVPALLDEDGSIYPSLRREPSLTRAWADAVLGSHLPGRPAWLSEIDYDRESYQHAHPVEWATGAAMLIEAHLAEEIGPWDERFFLYSEETDLFRRARKAGARDWFEPAARMRHRRGGSGSSSALTALMAVNRVRYAEKHHRPASAAGFRGAAVLSEALRSYQHDHRPALRALLNKGSWDDLPHAVPATRKNDDGGPASAFPAGSIIIPAHNERAVIARSLRSLEPVAAAGTVEIFVVCNGCTDDTAEIARSFPGIRVVEIEQPSKTIAMDTGDSLATAWPRLYLDADVEVEPAAIEQLFRRLGQGDILAARPDSRYDTDGATALVRAFYRARGRMASTKSGLWGAGAFALTREARSRFGTFPPVQADDVFVDRHFSDAEKEIVACPPIKVHVPSNARTLVTVLGRTYRSNVQLLDYQANEGGSSGQSLLELLSSIRGLRTGVDAGVYVGFAVVSRLRKRPAKATTWERDESSRG
ncbi:MULTISPECIES: WecB/TagA/CpsF family glycosyltransferase [Arthrobacter]|uniref:WecB/TagA/CpsF family glycosyltransferase n=1 Tax=Arthrobacter terricola TaxID=2547396 RepID=A0A4R5KXN4_9MICC|nr:MULTISPECIES: WecB/TagA/CpsF family glycosyltransferase [Arthrobacter]MBT8160338.1 WecB/TagA/CpsF family glycosyltransferase [Arthrobacter sp. GN70]TDF99968.1 WecB/TagA/CpsF family glycosyltransferase [Arthrobacter terricola]